MWLSFRRCRHGLCGVFGQHWGGPEGDAFGRAARRFEQMGVAALAINCIPPDHVAGMVSYLRDFVDLPLGVYPNLGYYTDRGWRFDPGVGGAEYAELALRWREEGAQIIGGCCGVRPGAHRGRARAPGRNPARSPPPARRARRGDAGRNPPRRGPMPAAARCTRCRSRSSMSSRASSPPRRRASWPGGTCSRRGSAPAAGASTSAAAPASSASSSRSTTPRTCTASTSTRARSSNTLANAFRNGVSDRLTAATVDLYPWVPEERYEVVVASLAQRPTDPFQSGASHRRSDYYGRMLLDQLIAKLPDALAPEGTAYIVQLSIVSQQHTAALLAEVGLEVQVSDYALCPPPPDYAEIRAQVERVEALSDAHHHAIGDESALAAYLLEIRHAG